MANRLQRSVQRLQAALRRLTPEDGLRARRNRRGRALAALRSVRAALDEAYPAIRAPGASRAKRVSAMKLSPKAKRRVIDRRMTARGLAMVGYNSPLFDAAALAGVQVQEDSLSDGVWIPAWVGTIYRAHHPFEADTAIAWVRRFARMTPRERRARLAEIALRSTTTEAGQ